MALSKSDRFASLSASELEAILVNKSSTNTKKATKYCSSVLLNYAREKNYKNIDEMNKSEIDELLEGFYAQARTVNGEKYTLATMKHLQQGIRRMFNDPPRNYGYNMETDFPKSAAMFKAVCVDLKRSGKANTDHKPVIVQSDRELLGEYFCDYKTSPEILIRKVWFDIMFNFCRRGREGLRELTMTSYDIKTDEYGRKYLVKIGSEVTKNHRTDGAETCTGGIMYESKGPHCPIASFELYRSKHNPKNDALFQYPRRNFKFNDEVWFDNRVMGKNTLGNMMTSISMSANLSQTYTNHSVRSTAITILSDTGYEARAIQTISKHKSVQSLENYVTDTSLSQKREMSTCLSGSVYPPNKKPCTATHATETPLHIPPCSSTGAASPVSAAVPSPSEAAVSVSAAVASLNEAAVPVSAVAVPVGAAVSEEPMSGDVSKVSTTPNASQSSSNRSFGDFQLEVESPTFQRILADITQQSATSTTNRNIHISGGTGTFNIYF